MQHTLPDPPPCSTMPASPFAISSQSSVFPTSTANQAPTIVKLDSSSLIGGTTASVAPAPKIVVVNMPAMQAKTADMGVRSMFEVGVASDGKTEAKTEQDSAGGDGSYM